MAYFDQQAFAVTEQEDKSIRMPEITVDTLIGDLIGTYPWAEAVIEKHFGRGCFTCPGMKMESIAFGAMMHNLDAKVVLQDLQEAAARAGSQAS